MSVLLDNASDSDPLAALDSINVVYHVKEKSRLFIKTGTEIGNNEGNMVLSCTQKFHLYLYLICFRMVPLHFVMYLVVLNY